MDMGGKLTGGTKMSCMNCNGTKKLIIIHPTKGRREDDCQYCHIKEKSDIDKELSEMDKK